MKQGKKLLILPAVAVLLGMGSACSGNSENKAQDMARKALMASVDNPEAVKIVGISKPDSVFGREYAYSGGYPFSISGDIRSLPS